MLTVSHYSGLDPEPRQAMSALYHWTKYLQNMFMVFSAPDLMTLDVGEKGWRCVLVVGHLSGVQKALGSIQTNAKQQAERN